MIKSYFVKYKQAREEKLKSIWLDIDIEIDVDQVSASRIKELITDKIYHREYVNFSEIEIKSVSLL